MNHTQRIAETARRHRCLTHRLARTAIDTYLELLAEEIAAGEWVVIPGVGKLQVVIEGGDGGTPLGQYQRLRTKVRLFKAFKQRRYSSE